MELVTGGSAAAPAEVVDSVEAELIDIGWRMPSYNPGRCCHIDSVNGLGGSRFA